MHIIIGVNTYVRNITHKVIGCLAPLQLTHNPAKLEP